MFVDFSRFLTVSDTHRHVTTQFCQNIIRKRPRKYLAIPRVVLKAYVPIPADTLPRNSSSNNPAASRNILCEKFIFEVWFGVLSQVTSRVQTGHLSEIRLLPNAQYSIPEGRSETCHTTWCLAIQIFFLFLILVIRTKFTKFNTV